MKTSKTTRPLATILFIAATSIFTASCHKESMNEEMNVPTGPSAAKDQNSISKLPFSPWKQKSSGVSAPGPRYY